MGIFYDIGKTLSYNCLFNFIVGPRGVGKTFAFKEWCIRDFVKNGNQFVYLRRYETELKKFHSFWNDIAQFHPELKFEVDGNEAFINDELAGWAFPLTKALTLKSTPFPVVNKIGFDEFIIDKGVYRYLADEVNSFLDIYETIARMRDIRAIFLSNAVTISNPYFAYFNINLPYGSDFSRKGDILIEYVHNEEYTNAKKNTRFGKLIEGTQYADYAFDNKFLRDSDTFVEKKSGPCHCQFTFQYQGTIYGVWINYSEGIYYVSYDYDKNCLLNYSLTTADHGPNLMLLKGDRKDTLLAKLFRNYKNGFVRFENIAIKNAVIDIIKLTY